MIKKKEIFYTVPKVEYAVNSAINFIFFYRLIFVTAALLALSYVTYQVWQYSIPQDRYKNIALVFSFGSIIIGIFYSIINFEHNQIKYKNEKRSTRLVLSFNAASDWHKPSMVENLKITKQLYDTHKSLIDDNKGVDFFKILEENEDARSALVSIFNFFECISLGVGHGMLDEEFIKSYFTGVYRQYVSNYGFYISYRRNVHNTPLSWINYTNLAAKWASEDVG